MSQFLKSTEVASQLNRSTWWVEVHSRLVNPQLPFLKSHKVLGKRRWLQSDIDAFIKENTVAGPDTPTVTKD